MWTRRQVHSALEDERVVFTGVGAVKDIRHTVLGGGFGLLGLWEQHNVVSQKFERTRKRLIQELRCGLSWVRFMIRFRVVVRVVDFRRRKIFRGGEFLREEYRRRLADYQPRVGRNERREREAGDWKGQRQQRGA